MEIPCYLSQKSPNSLYEVQYEAIIGIPSFLCPPPGFGISTRFRITTIRITHR
jgi:hypothetical protein